ncbi:PepSY domain-containing protein [Bacillus atrophaeus]|uniref:PepSY domain-containing protein n=1 Tax=Bacillus atrophaeus TaxID=1452 RepID=UPI00227EC873|nr:PepSY domain-containing protein [Bacillus atrophaeus]MCY8463800.1 PepSY domain-containing protein [Bacillus atrophaeus]MCY8476840.1 PepSY domain-containing protein [Bacillus atrophaeus]MCY8487918.1 PepSY domain-containing protein [Bacillus atrophaeus]MCY8815805.1 PepSY domain-containing protein [Bacillus atrophaeus]MCY8911368.1 PepSY domain-containing protein [Bacillus atrophaeus]
MKLRHLLLGAGLGIAAAVIVKQYATKPYISSEKALQIVKSAFKQRGPIDGSWIYTEPEPYHVNGETVHVYKTGVTRSAFGELEQYEVMVDAKTGTIVDVVDSVAS